MDPFSKRGGGKRGLGVEGFRSLERAVGRKIGRWSCPQGGRESVWVV